MANKIKKGDLTKLLIISEAKKVFNKNGLNLTLTELAGEMGVTISKITNHYPSKEHLFAALSVDYDKQLFELLESFSWGVQISFDSLKNLMSKIMDLQYENRCLIIFATSAGLNKTIMSEQIEKSWNSSLSGVKVLFKNMVDAGLLTKNSVAPKNFEILRFQYVNLLTTWLVSYTLYDHKLSLKEVKRIYLMGILTLFIPFLTQKGKLQLKQKN